jgi:hypothetical protein
MIKRPFKTILISICLFSFFLFACSDNDNVSTAGTAGDRSPENEKQASLPENNDMVTISQGVWGNVWFWEGNHMPSTDENTPTGKISPVEREIYIHEATTMADVTTAQDASFYVKIDTALVATTSSDSNGFYEATLLPGSYSIFVKENDLFYANSFTGDGEINQVTIEQDSVKKCQIDITYQAAF